MSIPLFLLRAYVVSLQGLAFLSLFPPAHFLMRFKLYGLERHLAEEPATLAEVAARRGSSSEASALTSLGIGREKVPSKLKQRTRASSEHSKHTYK